MHPGNRSRPRIQADLFPFLSILVCTMGTLILLIIVLTSQTLSNQRQVTIVAKSENGVNQSKQPRYIECRSDGVVIYPSQTFVSLSELNNSYSPLETLLQQISANRDKEYLIVAIRQDGIDVFKQVRSQIEQRGIDLGFEPLDEGWKLKIKSSNLESVIN